MKDEILLHIDDPVQLEKLYRSDKAAFRRAFQSLQPQLEGKALAHFWKARLNFAGSQMAATRGKDLLFVLVTCLLAGLLARLPDFIPIDQEFFYTRNAGFIVFFSLAALFSWQNKTSLRAFAVPGLVALAGIVFINWLPVQPESDTLALSCMHLILLLWSLLGTVFAANRAEGRLEYLKYNGDLVVMGTLLLISGAVLSGITIGLFSLIGLQIENFYFRNVVVFGLPAVPVLGTYLIRTHPQLVGRISPLIARIFSPLVLLMLLVYLAAMIYSGKDPYNDREFLIVFNALLIGVLAIIFFSVAEDGGRARNRAEIWVLFLLSALTVVVNGIALSAILFRISEWGITPNRAAVLGGNVLILANLLVVTAALFRAILRKGGIEGVRRVTAAFLPLYGIWAAVVSFVFPFVFGFR